MSFSVGCCPPSAWGELKPNEEYAPKGVVEEVDGVNVYRVGAGGRCVVWNYHIFGFDGGRVKQLCDQLAGKGEKEKLPTSQTRTSQGKLSGFMVILPDWFRGKMQDPAEGREKTVAFIREQTQWDSLRRTWQEKIKPYADSHGAKTYGAIGDLMPRMYFTEFNCLSIGTCWGTYLSVRLGSMDEFKTGVHLHPRCEH